MAALSRPGVAPTPPSMNDVLRRLPAESRARLLSHVTRVSIRKDQVLLDGASDHRSIYLPRTGLVSLQALTEDGNSVEIAMIGREGLIGFAPGIPTPGPTYNAVVSIPGEMFGVRTDVLLAEFDRVAATRQVLLTWWSLFLTEITQNAACHRFHSGRQRLARWLLSAADHTGATSFQLTHEDLAQRLGLQRKAVTVASLALQDVGAIRCRRGRIVLLDRRGLELAACECYRLSRRCDSAATPS